MINNDTVKIGVCGGFLDKKPLVCDQTPIYNVRRTVTRMNDN